MTLSVKERTVLYYMLFDCPYVRYTIPSTETSLIERGYLNRVEDDENSISGNRTVAITRVARLYLHGYLQP